MVEAFKYDNDNVWHYKVHIWGQGRWNHIFYARRHKFVWWDNKSSSEEDFTLSNYQMLLPYIDQFPLRDRATIEHHTWAPNNRTRETKNLKKLGNLMVRARSEQTKIQTAAKLEDFILYYVQRGVNVRSLIQDLWKRKPRIEVALKLLELQHLYCDTEDEKLTETLKVILYVPPPKWPKFNKELRRALYLKLLRWVTATKKASTQEWRVFRELFPYTATQPFPRGFYGMPGLSKLIKKLDFTRYQQLPKWALEMLSVPQLRRVIQYQACRIEGPKILAALERSCLGRMMTIWTLKLIVLYACPRWRKLIKN
uniref:Uncharacterized protein n=1 Tax=viral metagenome TaxID=1070528 RepID=A0A6C0BQL4_9ZZZZ